MGSSPMEEVIAQFRKLLGVIDETAVNAKRAQEDAERARSAYVEASRGTSDQLMGKAVVNSRTAAEKAGKTARLLSEAADHFATYINIIAPGTVPPRMSAPEATPSGEQVAEEATQSLNPQLPQPDHQEGRRPCRCHQHNDEGHGGQREGSRASNPLTPPPHPPGISPGTTTTSQTATPATPGQSSSVADGASAVTIALLGAAVVGRAAIRAAKRRVARKASDDDQK